MQINVRSKTKERKKKEEESDCNQTCRVISQLIVLVEKGENSWHRGRELMCEEVEGGGGRGEGGGSRRTS